MVAGWLAPPAPGQALQKVKVVTNWFAEPEQAAVYAALAAGIYRRHGLDVEVQQGGVRVSHVQLVGSGQAQFGMGIADDIYRSRAQGIPLVALFTTFQTYPQIILYHKAHPLTSFSDMDGRTVYVVPRASFWVYLKYAYHLDHVREIAHPGTLAPFLADPNSVIQGYISSEPFILQQQGATDIAWKLIADSGYNPYANIVYTTEQILRQDPQMVRTFVAASLEGLDFYFRHPQEVNTYLNAQNPQYSMALMNYSGKAMEPFVKTADTQRHGLGYMTAARWQQLYKQLRSSGVLTEDQDYTKAFTLQFVGK
jgi:NitT/TauT family transport system substrate-binding protein